MLVEQTAIQDSALPVAQFKDHLRMGSGFGDDTLQDAVLVGFLRAAITAIEARTGKAILERRFVWRFTTWRGTEKQILPVAPVTAVIAFKIMNAQDIETIIDPSRYRLSQDAHFPSLISNAGSFPVIPKGGQAELEFTAGFASLWDNIPADLAQAVLMLGAHYYEYRNDTGLADGCTPFGVTALLERYKPMRLGGGMHV